MTKLLHPTRTVVLAFLLAILVGTALLMTPMASSGVAPTPLLVAFFTAVSAVCVTGLVVVDTGTHWSFFGQFVIMLLFQIGGFGMMTAATLLGLMVNRSLRLRSRLIAQVETHSIGLGDVSGVAKMVLIVTLIAELILAAVLFARFHWGYHMPWSEALWHGVFHSVSAFNNAGFSLNEDSLMRFATDAWILLPIAMAIVVGGIGFPVFHDIRSRLRDPRHWSLHTKLTLSGTAVLLLGGTDLPTDQVIFEVISAFGTVGLSTGITADLPPSGQLMLTLLMYVGRVGTITLAASLAMGHVRAAYRYPEEHPIVG